MAVSNDKRIQGKILIVDDDETIRYAFQALLGYKEYEFDTACDGPEALRKVADFEPDVILLDVMMPGMDGFEVCQMIKSNQNYRHIPVILVTALDTKEDLSAGLEAGADEFLSKPVEGVELKARVRSMLRIKRQYDELADLLRLRDDLENMIVHDMRSPLTIIYGVSEDILNEPDLTPNQLRWLEKIRTQAQRLNSQMNDMLLLAKMERGQLALDLTQIDLRTIVHDTEINHSNIAAARHVTFQLELPDAARMVSVDENLMARVVDNLVSNAIKFSPADSTIILRIKDQDGHPDLQVIDQGSGIPEEHHDKIFDKFEIVALKQQGIPQIGLGLAFCKMVVEAHGGRIYVEDNDPRGAIFHVELSLA